MSDALATIREAASRAAPDTAILVGSGTYTNHNYGNGGLSNPAAVSLSNAHRILLRNLPGHEVRIRFDGAGGIICSNCTDVEIAGFVVTGPGAEMTEEEATADRLLHSPRFSGRGIVVWGGSHVWIHNNTVGYCPNSGIRINRGDYCTVSDNEVYNNTWWSSNAESAIVFAESAPIDDLDVIKMRIVRNRVHGNRNIIPYCKATAYPGHYVMCSPDATLLSSLLLPALPWVPRALLSRALTRPVRSLSCGGADNARYDDPAYLAANQMHVARPNYGSVNQTFIIDGSGVYISRNSQSYTSGRYELSDNVCYGNGINGVVVHKTNRAHVYRNVLYGNGVVSREPPASRQPYAGLVITNSLDVEVINNSVSTTLDTDFAYATLVRGRTQGFCFSVCSARRPALASPALASPARRVPQVQFRQPVELLDRLPVGRQPRVQRPRELPMDRPRRLCARLRPFAATHCLAAAAMRGVRRRAVPVHGDQRAHVRIVGQLHAAEYVQRRVVGQLGEQSLLRSHVWGGRRRL